MSDAIKTSGRILRTLAECCAQDDRHGPALKEIRVRPMGEDTALEATDGRVAVRLTFRGVMLPAGTLSAATCRRLKTGDEIALDADGLHNLSGNPAPVPFLPRAESRAWEWLDANFRPSDRTHATGKVGLSIETGVGFAVRTLHALRVDEATFTFGGPEEPVYLRGQANVRRREGDKFTADILAMPCQTDEAVATLPKPAAQAA